MINAANNHGSTGVKSVRQCKLHIVILDYDLLKDNRTVSKSTISRKTMTKILCVNFEKKFSQMRKNCFKKDLPALPFLSC